MYHQLLNPESYRNRVVPSAEQLLQETQTQLFAGTDTTVVTLMHGSFCILRSPKIYQNLKEELLTAWPDLEQPPSLSDLEQLPYMVGQ